MINYLKGLGCFYLAAWIFFAVDWINAGAEPLTKYFIFPVLVSFITWSLIYVVHILIIRITSTINGLPIFIVLIDRIPRQLAAGLHVVKKIKYVKLYE